MTWVMLGLLAGLLLGTYDFFTKFALREKSVMEVVFLSSFLGSLLWLPLFFLPNGAEVTFKPLGLFPEALPLWSQLLILPKSVMMVVTWVLSYYSVKMLPLSISAGVRASGPIWTSIGAVMLLGEMLTFLQMAGILTATCAYYYFATIGRREGISFQKNIWVLSMLAATLLSSANALYDKYIVVSLSLDIGSIQAYSAVQRAVIACALLPWIYRDLEIGSMLTRNWAIPMIAVTYVAAEFIYLWSVTIDGALISVISILRRTNLIMVFGLSAIFLAESNIVRKVVAIAGVLAGITLVIVR